MSNDDRDRSEVFRDREHIKSFVIRAARMSPAQRKAYDELAPRYCVPVSGQAIEPAQLFPVPERPVYLEIGFGMGDATWKMASAMLEINFLGVEVHKPGVGKLLRAIREHSLENVRIIHDDAMLSVERMIPAESVDAVLLFFPDPWPKKRHHKRRIVRPGFVGLLTERLRPGGFIYAVTDWEEYAEWMLGVFSKCPGLRNEYEGYAPRQPWRPLTSFEKKGVEADREIRELFFRRA